MKKIIIILLIILSEYSSPINCSEYISRISFCSTSSFKITPVGSPADAPAFLRLKFGEHLCEIGEDSASYNGLISSSWIQEEYIHIDVLPAEIKMPRRYAFRYMEILVKDTSVKYKVKIDDVKCDTISSVDINKVEKLKTLRKI